MTDDLLSREPVRRVQQALIDAGSDAQVMALSATARTAQDAASALGCALGAIVKSLVFRAGDQAVMALIAGDRQCDLKALRDDLGLSGKPKRADADFVRTATGFSIGGVSPLGHSQEIMIAADESLNRFKKIYAAAGHPHCVFPIDFETLVMSTKSVISKNIGR